MLLKIFIWKHNLMLFLNEFDDVVVLLFSLINLNSMWFFFVLFFSN